MESSDRQERERTYSLLQKQSSALREAVYRLHETDTPDQRERSYQAIIRLLQEQIQQLHSISAGMQMQQTTQQQHFEALHEHAEKSARAQNRFNILVSAVSLVAGAILSEGINLLIRH